MSGSGLDPFIKERLGFDVIIEPSFDRGWNGKFPMRATSVSGGIHEIGHWLVTPKSRRNKPGYGLGTGPDDASYTEKYVTDSLATREEERASLLGILIERELGLDFMRTWREHSWNQDFGSTPKDTLRWLIRKNHIRYNGFRFVPTIVTDKPQRAGAV